MIRSRIAVAGLLIGTLATALPGMALAAASGPTPTSCNACGAPFNDLEQGPFVRRDYITGVEPYRVTETNLKRSWTKLEGAVVTVRPAPGVTREWLQRTVQDHMGQMTAGAPMNDCPLSVVGAAADVSSTGNGFAITIHSKDKDGAQEILRRASMLVSR
jgi:hypothetical protein